MSVSKLADFKIDDERVNSSTLTDSSADNSTNSTVSSKSQKPPLLKPIANDLRCTLSWSDLEYWIPISAERKELISDHMSAAEMASKLAIGDEQDRGLPLPTIVKNGPFSEP